MSTPRATILMYHRVDEAFADPDEGDYVLPSALFEAQMRLLDAQRRPVVSLAALAAGEYPDRSVALTFDDGCDTDATVAAPTLRALGFPAAFFVNPARVGHTGRMSWAQLSALADDGFLIGSHGLDHTLLDGLPADELQRQLATSKRWLEDRLARPIETMALPGGSGGERVRRAAEEAGYRLVLGSRPGVVRGSAAFGIQPRLGIRRGHGLSGFTAAIDQQPLFLLRQGLRYRALDTGRFLLGAQAYGRLRMRWLQWSVPPRRA
jgi:peptidoglycan/xylan/chitin deacetylase (PgdA/CDA1 family)